MTFIFSTMVFDTGIFDGLRMRFVRFGARILAVCVRYGEARAEAELKRGIWL